MRAGGLVPLGGWGSGFWEAATGRSRNVESRSKPGEGEVQQPARSLFRVVVRSSDGSLEGTVLLLLAGSAGCRRQGVRR